MRPPDLETLLREALDAENLSEVDRVGALLDAEDEADRRRRAKVSLTAAALWYAERGLRVFPLWPGSKTPRIPSPHPRGSPERARCKGECGQLGHGCHDGTTDTDHVRSWWRFTPEANIGISTGTLVDVIDIDGPEGNLALTGLKTPTRLGWASTPRPGGRHIYVPATGRGGDSGILPGIDYRGAGGYVVAAPSVIAPGGKDHPGAYRWIRPLEIPGPEAA